MNGRIGVAVPLALRAELLRAAEAAQASGDGMPALIYVVRPLPRAVHI